MFKKQDSFYFENFVACADSACQAAAMLRQVVEHYDPDRIYQQLEEMHNIEHKADQQRHELLAALVKAFITPLEREDIMDLSRSIDEVTDKIEDVGIRIYYNNIRTIQPDAIAMVDVIVRCCQAVKSMMQEFPNFKSAPKELYQHIIEINSMEGEADKLYIQSMHNLHSNCTDPLTVIAWREIYNYLEKCADACEHVADAVESALMKNT